MNTYTDTVFVSGVIDNDSTKPVKLSVDADYEIHCKSFDMITENSVKFSTALDGGIIFNRAVSMPLKISVRGVTSINENKCLSDSIIALSEKTLPFSIALGDETFSSLLLLKSESRFDDYGLKADCTLTFIKVGENYNG